MNAKISKKSSLLLSRVRVRQFFEISCNYATHFIWFFYTFCPWVSFMGYLHYVLPWVTFMWYFHRQFPWVTFPETSMLFLKGLLPRNTYIGYWWIFSMRYLEVIQRNASLYLLVIELVQVTTSWKLKVIYGNNQKQ